MRKLVPCGPVIFFPVTPLKRRTISDDSLNRTIWLGVIQDLSGYDSFLEVADIFPAKREIRFNPSRCDQAKRCI